MTFDKSDDKQKSTPDVQQANEASEQMEKDAAKPGTGGPGSAPVRGTALMIAVKIWEELWDSLPKVVVNGKEKLNTQKFNDDNWKVAEKMDKDMPTHRAQVTNGADEAKKHLALASTSLDQFG